MNQVVNTMYKRKRGWVMDRLETLKNKRMWNSVFVDGEGGRKVGMYLLLKLTGKKPLFTISCFLWG